ncbi:Dystonin [Dirofilaria immitis]|nr:Dystonin [Dirofilaria immitis]
MSLSSTPFSHQGYSSDVSSSEYYCFDSNETECLEHYENNLEKYKDERDAIQKKTFTKWINKHLGKTGLHVEDLFVDLTDGYNLIALLEALSAEKLPRENGGSPKLTLGLIWTIILNFQVSVIKQRQREASGSQGNTAAMLLCCYCYYAATAIATATAAADGNGNCSGGGGSGNGSGGGGGDGGNKNLNRGRSCSSSIVVVVAVTVVVAAITVAAAAAATTFC